MILASYYSHTRTYLKTDICKFGTLNVSLLHLGSEEALFFWQCAFVLSDLQPVTWGHCRKRWCESGASHHRDKQPECCGCSPREDSEPACHFCWRSKCAISWLQYQLEAHMKAWELVHETNIPCPDQIFCACRYS